MKRPKIFEKLENMDGREMSIFLRVFNLCNDYVGGDHRASLVKENARKRQSASTSCISSSIFS
ncbi:MAG: hypothetical protein LBM19_00215 [Holosporales bacterium]|jgi:hypothetical protein|nr:hypothetical protein [Holosporales bacterium]